ncbi:unnamed protein product [Didymodactylos carnosus]|uniref:Uncharacterized protein n=1 Tax=Didymodactylos carnosus TaxID=1234261 RepID=A0A813Q7K0_9BILA|nr:unnamed protein product [Didymodactylos carnosus]CAF1013916.1 unnamed protein product [Didymodactylos carnosus]CAF3544372.1 unnamed protein product [Didymodactylos carnosus]CAF3782891.1 unnamed protein product [Didymodactylos carnosus]
MWKTKFDVNGTHTSSSSFSYRNLPILRHHSLANSNKINTNRIEHKRVSTKTRLDSHNQFQCNIRDPSVILKTRLTEQNTNAHHPLGILEKCVESEEERRPSSPRSYSLVTDESHIYPHQLIKRLLRIDKDEHQRQQQTSTSSEIITSSTQSFDSEQKHDDCSSSSKNNTSYIFTTPSSSSLSNKIESLNTNYNHKRQNENTGFVNDKYVADILLHNQQSIDHSKIFRNLIEYFEKKKGISIQKKILKAKRTIKRNYPNVQLEINSTTTKSSTINNNDIYHRIKRMKKFHKQLPTIMLTENVFSNEKPNSSQSAENDIITSIVQEYDNHHKHETKVVIQRKLSIFWFLFIIIISALFVYHTPYLIEQMSTNQVLLSISMSSNHYLTFIERYITKFQEIFREPSSKIDTTKTSQSKSYLYRYGQFIQKIVFKSFDIIFKYIGIIFFLIEKYECPQKLAYFITATYENIVKLTMKLNR